MAWKYRLTRFQRVYWSRFKELPNLQVTLQCAAQYLRCSSSSDAIRNANHLKTLWQRLISMIMLNYLVIISISTRNALSVSRAKANGTQTVKILSLDIKDKVL